MTENYTIHKDVKVYEKYCYQNRIRANWESFFRQYNQQSISEFFDSDNCDREKKIIISIINRSNEDDDEKSPRDKFEESVSYQVFWTTENEERAEIISFITKSRARIALRELRNFKRTFDFSTKKNLGGVSGVRQEQVRKSIGFFGVYKKLPVTNLKIKRIRNVENN